MPTPWTCEQIYDEIKAMLVDALAVEENQIGLASDIVKDLGAEIGQGLLDALDIAFRMSKIFDIEVDHRIDFAKVNIEGPFNVEFLCTLAAQRLYITWKAPQPVSV